MTSLRKCFLLVDIFLRIGKGSLVIAVIVLFLVSYQGISACIRRGQVNDVLSLQTESPSHQATV